MIVRVGIVIVVRRLARMDVPRLIGFVVVVVIHIVRIMVLVRNVLKAELIFVMPVKTFVRV